MSAVRTITLGGRLGAEFGRTHHFAVANMAEVMRALCTMLPGFEKFLMESKDKGMNFVVKIGRENPGEEDLKRMSPLGDEEVIIMPIMQGAKEGGILQVVAGIALIAIGAFVQWWMGGAPNAFSNYMYGAGISMIVGGISQMLAPQPKKEDAKAANLESYVFNGSVNVQAQGNPVPILYGTMWTGSAVVSAGIDATDNYIVPSNPDWDGFKYRDGGGYFGDIVARSRNEF